MVNFTIDSCGVRPCVGVRPCMRVCVCKHAAAFAILNAYIAMTLHDEHAHALLCVCSTVVEMLTQGSGGFLGDECCKTRCAAKSVCAC